MTARTLEEIEALDAQANASGETTRMRAMEFPRVLAIAQEQRAEIARLREFVREIRDDWDCDTDAHRYGTSCRCCDAEKLIGTKR